jgi:hypothetical protein
MGLKPPKCEIRDREINRRAWQRLFLFIKILT